jgi:hypothetical protein
MCGEAFTTAAAGKLCGSDAARGHLSMALAESLIS